MNTQNIKYLLIFNQFLFKKDEKNYLTVDNSLTNR
jgi:hypothetical protein